MPEGSLSPDCLVAMASSLTSRGQPRCTKQRFARVPVAPVHIATSAQHPLPTFRLLSAVGREPAQNAKQQSHSARRHNSAAHRALKSARPRSRHARTQNNAPRTNQGHSLRGNNSAARRASAPARDIAPTRGARASLPASAHRPTTTAPHEPAAQPRLAIARPQATPRAVTTPGRVLPPP